MFDASRSLLVLIYLVQVDGWSKRSNRGLMSYLTGVTVTVTRHEPPRLTQKQRALLHPSMHGLRVYLAVCFIVATKYLAAKNKRKRKHERG